MQYSNLVQLLQTYRCDISCSGGHHTVRHCFKDCAIEGSFCSGVLSVRSTRVVHVLLRNPSISDSTYLCEIKTFQCGKRMLRQKSVTLADVVFCFHTGTQQYQVVPGGNTNDGEGVYKTCSLVHFINMQPSTGIVHCV